MSSSDENAKIGSSVGSNGTVGDPKPCCSNSSSNLYEHLEDVKPEGKFQDNRDPNSDCINHYNANGGYLKTVPNKTINIYENGSIPDVECATQCDIRKELDAQCDLSPDKNKIGSLLKNNIECQPDNASRPGTVPKVPYCTNREPSLDCDINSSSEDEECCIYTYKGDSNQMADLPSSFFRLDLMHSKPNGNSRNSSPDMDYLEMDFDPGPSNDRYGSSGSECGEDRFMAEEPLSLSVDCEIGRPDPTPPSPLSTPSPVNYEQPCSSAASIPKSLPTSPQHTSELNIVSSISQPMPCYCVTTKLSPTSIDENFNEGVGGTMIWKEQEAREKQVNQISISACGATAVINTLLGLNVPFLVSSVKQYVATRLRRNDALIPDYLQSRYNAGSTHEDMIRGLHNASNGLVFARFFHMYPQRSVSLTSWLSHWIRKGAVPIVIRNMQCGLQPGTEIPDMWHHQMVYGVSVQGIHLTNPLEVQSELLLKNQLASPSVLKVRREDILSRWTPDTSLLDLAHPSLPLWRKLNVLGQVVNVIRENSISQWYTNKHITIPVSYSSGVILAVLVNSPAYEELRFTPELPVDPFFFS